MNGFPNASITWNDEFLVAAFLYLQDSGNLVLELDSPSNVVPWVSVDPFPKSSDQQRAHSLFPNFFEGPSAFECTVRAGELLYL